MWQRSNEENLDDDWNLFAEYRRFWQHPVRFMRDFQKMISGQDFAAYDDYIGGRLYQLPNFTNRIKESTLKQPVVVDCVNKLVNQELQREKDLGIIKNDTDLLQREKVCREQLASILDKIATKALPTFSSITAVRFDYFFVSQTLSKGYLQGMHISKAQAERLRAKALELQKKKQSLVLFPCHKSHADYIALVYTFFRIGLSLPMTVAGDNLDILLVNWFIRQVGATFIRRGNWKEDPLYSAFFQGLINTFLQQGYNVQCFIEGTRSRTGKLLPPKYGIIKFIIEALTSGAVEDCWIVPISTQYDKAMEADTYATELMGREKKGENLKTFLDSRSIFNMNLGRIDVRIGEGFSLRQYLVESLKDNVPRPVMLRTLAYKVLGDINDVSVVMPSALVGTVLLTTRQPGLSKEDLVLRVDRLIGRILRRGSAIGAIPKAAHLLNHQDIAMIVETAIEVLGPDLVTVESKRLLEPVCYAKDEFKLSYYRNQLVHLFVAEALTCISIYQHYTTNLSLQIPIKELKNKVLFLSRLLSGEFVFNNEDTLVGNLKETLQILQDESIIVKHDEEFVYVNPQEVRDDWALTHFYTYLVWPFIDGYWSAAMSLQMLPPQIPIKRKQFMTTAQHVANTLYSEGALTHDEACNLQVIQSAIAQAESRGLISLTRTSITLTATPEEMTRTCEEISLYRNEVMLRPSGSLLVRRVENLGKPLIESARL